MAKTEGLCLPLRNTVGADPFTARLRYTGNFVWFLSRYTGNFVWLLSGQQVAKKDYHIYMYLLLYDFGGSRGRGGGGGGGEGVTIPKILIHLLFQNIPKNLDQSFHPIIPESRSIFPSKIIAKI